MPLTRRHVKNEREEVKEQSNDAVTQKIQSEVLEVNQIAHKHEKVCRVPLGHLLANLSFCREKYGLHVDFYLPLAFHVRCLLPATSVSLLTTPLSRSHTLHYHLEAISFKSSILT